MFFLFASTVYNCTHICAVIMNGLWLSLFISYKTYIYTFIYSATSHWRHIYWLTIVLKTLHDFNQTKPSTVWKPKKRCIYTLYGLLCVYNKNLANKQTKTVRAATTNQYCIRMQIFSISITWALKIHREREKDIESILRRFLVFIRLQIEFS